MILHRLVSAVTLKKAKVNQFSLLFTNDVPLVWKFARFKYCTALTDVDTKEQALIADRAHFLSKVLQCEEKEATEIVNRNVYLLVKDKEGVKKKANFLRSHFTLQDIMQYPELLSLPNKPIKEEYFTMMEFGFKNISCLTLLNFKNLIRKSPTELIELEQMDSSCDPLQSALLVLDCPAFSQLAKNEFLPHRYMASPVLALKRSLLSRYLAHIFGSSIDQARLIIRLHYKLSGRCFTSLKECLDILQEVYGFPIEKVRVNPYLLEGKPENLRKIASLPTLMGSDPMEIAHKFPKVIAQPVENLLEIETMLREKEVADNVLRESRYLFTLSPETVRDIIIKRKLKRMLGR